MLETERPFAEQPSMPEMPKMPERAGEMPERRMEKPQPKAKEMPVMPSMQPASDVKTSMSSAKTESRQRIEKVMEDGLAEVYKTMPAETKKQFREEGEKTAAEIETLLYKVKVQSKKIFQLIFAWLRIIPGVNKYFLEQEAKLKTDELIRLKEEMEKNKSEQRVW